MDKNKKFRIAAVIPARMASSRFPGKPMTSILGLPMIEHVRRRTQRVNFLDEVVVATCDLEIKELVESFGGKVVMTKDSHQRATDRIEEAAHVIDADIFINVQGDEPMVSELAIEKVIEPFLKNPNIECTCLCYPVTDLSDLTNKNVVKVVLSQSGRILYLSRNSLPGFHGAEDQSAEFFKQSGIMAFKKDFLHKYTKLVPTPLEKAESVDMLRVLEHDYWIQGVVSDLETIGVDVPEQVRSVEAAILSNPGQKKIFDEIDL